MVRVTGPCFSLDARKTIGEAITYSFWRGINYVRSRVVPHNPRSDRQTEIRAVLTDAVSTWKLGGVPAEDKAKWNFYAKGLGESGFNRYVRAYISLNYDATTGQRVEPPTMPEPA